MVSSFMVSSSRIFKITCEATAIYLACGRIAFLSDIFYSQEKYAQLFIVSESIYEQENHERDRDTNDKTKKIDFIGLEHHNRTICNQI